MERFQNTCQKFVNSCGAVDICHMECMPRGRCHFDDVRLEINNFRHLGLNASRFMGVMLDGHSHEIIYAREMINKQTWYRAELARAKQNLYPWIMDIKKLELWKKRNIGVMRSGWDEVVITKIDKSMSVSIYRNGVHADLNKFPLNSTTERLIPRSAAEYLGDDFLAADPVYRSLVNFTELTRWQ